MPAPDIGDYSPSPVGALRTLSWVARSPHKSLKHAAYFRQQLRLMLGRPLVVGPTGAPIRRQLPWFVEENCQPLNQPSIVPADRADHMQDDDVVMGIEMSGSARAYPYWIMDNHHVANDTVGGEPVVIVLCEACSTAVAFDPVVEGRQLTFRHDYVFNGTVAISDRQTGSVWSTYLATAISGRLRGKQLRVLPLTQVTWRDWRAWHPETDVVAAHPSREAMGAQYGYDGSQWGLFPVFFRDVRADRTAIATLGRTASPQRARHWRARG